MKFAASNTLMVQGTTSDAGKSVLVAGLCRLFARRGIKVAPLKPQNMALNSAVTADGGEIGRAQAVQALACGLAAHTDFNPVLLKPNTDTGAQVIIHGRALSNMEAAQYHDYKAVAMQAVLDSHRRLSDTYELIVVEGAGSPAEINLRQGDIANMGFAEAVDCPVVLVADIDRGGVFAHLVGTLELLAQSEQARVVGFVINKFRGDIALLKSGLDWLEQKTGKPVLGVIPYLPRFYLEAEDAIDTSQRLERSQLTVAVLGLPHISNHTDFDPLRLQPQVDLRYVAPGQALPACDLVIIPGSKNVRADLVALHRFNWHNELKRHLRYGGKLLGICGGYQMLGHLIDDPQGIEGPAGSSDGLGLLALETRLQQDKQLKQVQGYSVAQQHPIKGYEIHAGISRGPALQQPLFTLEDQHGTHYTDGAVSEDQQVAGTYLHGLFDTAEGLAWLFDWLELSDMAPLDSRALQLEQLERLADCLEQQLDLDRLQTHLR